jgi:succinoglycan biosynthesis protein ExoA
MNKPSPVPKLENSVQPFVTVIMPVRDEATFIERSLGALLAQDYDCNRMEIIVVDGMSADGTREAVRQIIDQENTTKKNNGSSHRLVLADNPSRIVPPALNIGLRQARGEIIIRVDGHCDVGPDYVRRCVETLGRVDADCVGGPIRTVGKTPIAQAIALAQSSSFGVGGVAFRMRSDRGCYVDTLAFGAYRREIFHEIGEFDEELVRNQDDEFNYRLIHHGGKIWLDPSICSVYYSRASLSGLWKQYFQYGFWKVRVLQKHPLQMHLRQFVPPVFVAVLLLSLLASPFTMAGRLVFGLAAISYALANLAASVLTARKGGWRLLKYLPFVFLSLHVAYGTGFLTGFIRFCNRWSDRGRKWEGSGQVYSTKEN